MAEQDLPEESEDGGGGHFYGMKDVSGAVEEGQRQAVLSLRQMKIAKQWAFWDSFVFTVSSGWLCPGPSQEGPTLQRPIVALAYLKQ